MVENAADRFLNRAMGMKWGRIPLQVPTSCACL